MTVNCYISTGQKSVLHTLWTVCIPAPKHPFPPVHTYMRNLPVNEKEAIKKAKAFAKENNFGFIGVLDSPLCERAKYFDRFDIHFTSRRKKGKVFFMGIASPEFWDEWRTNKEQLKEEGFSVSKFRHPMKNVDIWYVFYRPEINKKEA